MFNIKNLRLVKYGNGLHKVGFDTVVNIAIKSDFIVFMDMENFRGPMKINAVTRN